MPDHNKTQQSKKYVRTVCIFLGIYSHQLTEWNVQRTVLATLGWCISLDHSIILERTGHEVTVTLMLLCSYGRIQCVVNMCRDPTISGLLYSSKISLICPHEYYTHHIYSELADHILILRSSLCSLGENIGDGVFYTNFHDFYGFFIIAHDDVIKWKYFPRYWSFARPVNSPHEPFT